MHIHKAIREGTEKLKMLLNIKTETSLNYPPPPNLELLCQEKQKDKKKGGLETPFRIVRITYVNDVLFAVCISLHIK